MTQKDLGDWQTYGYRMEDAPCEHAVPVNDLNDTGYVKADRDAPGQDPFDDGAVDEGLRGERSRNVNQRDSEFWDGPERANIERGENRKKTAMEKTRKKHSVNQKVMWGFLTFIALALIAAAIVFTTLPRIRTIEVEGNERFSAAEICRLAGVRAGDNLLFLDEEEIKARINGNRYLKAVGVETEWPDRVKIVVREREQAVWLRHNGITYVMDSRGMVLEQTGDLNAVPDMLEVTGLTVNRCQVGSVLNVSNPRQLSFLRNLCVELKAMKLAKLVRVCDMENLQLKTSDDCWVRLGSTDELHAKLRVMTMVRDWLLSGDGMVIAGGTIDVTNPREPTYEPPKARISALP